MKFIRKRVLAGEVMLGVGANLGSSLTVEMIGAAGFDWTWIDCRHLQSIQKRLSGSGFNVQGLQPMDTTDHIYSNPVMFANDFSNIIIPPSSHQTQSLINNRYLLFVPRYLCSYSFRFIHVRKK